LFINGGNRDFLVSPLLNIPTRSDNNGVIGFYHTKGYLIATTLDLYYMRAKAAYCDEHYWSFKLSPRIFVTSL